PVDASVLIRVADVRLPPGSTADTAITLTATRSGTYGAVQATSASVLLHDPSQPRPPAQGDPTVTGDPSPQGLQLITRDVGQGEGELGFELRLARATTDSLTLSLDLQAAPALTLGVHQISFDGG